MKAKLGLRKCKTCGLEFLQARPMQSVCSPSCALDIARKLTTKKQQEASKELRKQVAEARVKARTRGEWQQLAQDEFNRYIRMRDKDLPCISCGRFHDGQWHAGHFQSIGAHPELRFEPDNVHKQCQPCNTHKHGNLNEYRAGLIKKIGIERVQWLEGPHDHLKLSIPDLIAIRDKYRALIKEMKK
jgi:5-methylcytosine-specific restriction endonuclease McrA